jgi:hypothetical protein
MLRLTTILLLAAALQPVPAPRATADESAIRAIVDVKPGAPPQGAGG